MANNGVPITFLDIHCNSFYFTEEKDDWKTDAFRQSGKVSTYRIKSRDNKSLILHTEGDFQFENSTGDFDLKITIEPVEMKEEKKRHFEGACWHQFNIQTYNSSDLKQKKGLAVMLYVYKDQQKMVACCDGESKICAKAMELPTELHKTSDEALFYMVKLSAPSSYQFESTLHPGWFLGFQQDDYNASRHKLVLIQGRNEVDNFSPMQMEKS